MSELDHGTFSHEQLDREVPRDEEYDEAPDWRARAMLDPPFTFQQRDYIRRAVHDAVQEALRGFTAELTTRGVRSSDLRDV